MTEKLVSIIIPTYNGHEAVPRAVESALNQTYKNTEIIVVDDNGIGSKEQELTKNSLGKYISENRIKYIAHEVNKNGSAARNTGIRASSGEYIAFLDDDDIWFEEKLKKQIEVFDRLDRSYGMLFCGGYNIDTKGFGGRKLSKFPKGNILYDLLIGKVDFNSSMLVIRREVLKDVIEFDESYRRLQDWEFCTRILYKYKGYGMEEYLVAKIRAERNLTSNPEQLLAIYEHHMSKIKEILHSLGTNREKKVKARFYRRIALEYFKTKNIRKGFTYLGKEENTVKGFVLLSKYVLSHGIYRILHRKQKIVDIE